MGFYERARFNWRNQLDGEQVEQYIMELYKLADNCDMTDEMIRDRLVVGIKCLRTVKRESPGHSLSGYSVVHPRVLMVCQAKAVWT